MLMAINIAVFVAQFLSKDRLLLWGAKVRSHSSEIMHAAFMGHSSYGWIGLTCSGEEWHEQLGNVTHCSAILHIHFCCSVLRVLMPFHVGSLVWQQHHAQESPANQVAISARTGQTAGQDTAVMAPDHLLSAARHT